MVTSLQVQRPLKWSSVPHNRYRWFVRLSRRKYRFSVAVVRRIEAEGMCKIVRLILGHRSGLCTVCVRKRETGLGSSTFLFSKDYQISKTYIFISGNHKQLTRPHKDVCKNGRFWAIMNTISGQQCIPRIADGRKLDFKKNIALIDNGWWQGKHCAIDEKLLRNTGTLRIFLPWPEKDAGADLNQRSRRLIADNFRWCTERRVHFDLCRKRAARNWQRSKAFR